MRICALIGVAAVVGALSWHVLSEHPREAPLRLEIEHTMKDKRGLRLISESSPFMRSER
jgi:hypothetical protein